MTDNNKVFEKHHNMIRKNIIKDENQIPCINCISLPVCISKLLIRPNEPFVTGPLITTELDPVFDILDKCNMLSDYITYNIEDGIGEKWSMSRICNILNFVKNRSSYDSKTYS